MKVHCLKPVDIELNEYIGQFLVSAIKSSLRYYSYADQISSTVLPNLYIMLPSTTDHKPDWKYMEQYMQRIENKVTNDISLIIRSLEGGYVSWQMLQAGKDFICMIMNYLQLIVEQSLTKLK